MIRSVFINLQTHHCYISKEWELGNLEKWKSTAFHLIYKFTCPIMIPYKSFKWKDPFTRKFSFAESIPEEEVYVCIICCVYVYATLLMLLAKLTPFIIGEKLHGLCLSRQVFLASTSSTSLVQPLVDPLEPCDLRHGPVCFRIKQSCRN